MRPSSRHSSWLVLALFAVLPAVVSGCVIRAQPQPVYANDPNYVPPQPAYTTDPSYVAPQTGAIEVDATVYPSSAPPPPVAEYRPTAPGYGYLWVDGYWDWNGYDWAWSNGYWQPQRSGYIFIGPRYVYESGRPVYYRGYWQGSNGYRDYHYVAPSQPEWRGRPTAAPSGGWRGTPPAATGGWRGTTPPANRAAPPPAGGWRGASPAAAAPPPSSGGWRGSAPAPAPAGGNAGAGNWRATPGAAPPPSGYGQPAGNAASMPGAHPAPAPAGGGNGGGGIWRSNPPASGTAPPPAPGAANRPVFGGQPYPGAAPAATRPAPAPAQGGWHPAPGPAPTGNAASQFGNAHPPTGGGMAGQMNGGAHPGGAAGQSMSAHPSTASPGASRPAPAPVQSAPPRRNVAPAFRKKP
jgi:hypothetical protein